MALKSFFLIFQVNGASSGTCGLEDLSLTSGDHESRSHHQHSSANHSLNAAPTTQQLEAKTIAPGLANTLEHIVGQLDIITQVSHL